MSHVMEEQMNILEILMRRNTLSEIFLSLWYFYYLFYECVDTYTVLMKK